MAFLPTGYRLDGRIRVCDIELQKFSAATNLLDQTDGFLRRRVIGNIIDNDTEPHLGKLHTHRAAYASASTGHKSVFGHKIFIINFSANLRNNFSSS